MSEQVCQHCSKSIVRKRYDSGRLENPSAMRRRRFCDNRCAQLARERSSRTGLPKLGSRTLVAKTCADCGEMLDAERFHRGATSYDAVCYGCRYRRDWARLTSEEQRAKKRSDWRRDGERNRTTRDRERHGHLWTSWELELVVRSDLTAAEVAERVGRTIAAVEFARHRAHTEPKFARLAGLIGYDTRSAWRDRPGSSDLDRSTSS